MLTVVLLAHEVPRVLLLFDLLEAGHPLNWFHHLGLLFHLFLRDRPRAFLLFVLTLHLLICFLILSLLLFWFSLDIHQILFIVAVKVLVMEVALRVVLAYFMEIVHVELNERVNTCLTKDE